MSLSLRVIIQNFGDDGAPRAVDITEERVVLGRSDSCDLRLPFPVVSKRHLSLVCYEESYFFADLGSTNGTLLDGRRVTPNDYVRITEGMRLEIGELALRFELIDDALLGEGFTLAESATVMREMVGEALWSGEVEAGDDRPFFEILGGPGAGRRLYVPDELQEGWIGAGAGADISLDAPEIGEHAVRLVRRSGELVAEPQEGIEVLLDRAPSYEPRELQSGMRLVLGTVELLFYDPLQDYLDELDELDGGGAKTGVQPAHPDVDGDTPRVLERTGADAAIAGETSGADPSEESSPGAQSEADGGGLDIEVDVEAPPPPGETPQPSGEEEREDGGVRAEEARGGLGGFELALLVVSVVLLLGGTGILLVIFEVI